MPLYIRGHSNFAHKGTLSNHAPSDIALSNSTIIELNSIGDVIGALSTTDQDSGNTFTYSIDQTYGDYAAFAISGANLTANHIFQYDYKSSYSVKIISRDQSNLSTDKIFAISVNSVAFPVINNVGLLFKTNATEYPVLNSGDGYYYTPNFKLRLTSGVYYVHTWYDRSGNNNHAIQTTEANQPVFDIAESEVYFNEAVPSFLKVTHSATIDITTGDVSISIRTGKVKYTNFILNKGAGGSAQVRFSANNVKYYSPTSGGSIEKFGGIAEAVNSQFSYILDRDASYTLYKDKVSGTPQAFNNVGNIHTTEDLFIGRLGGLYNNSCDCKVSFICFHGVAYTAQNVSDLVDYANKYQASYDLNNITYSSTIDAISNLAARVVYRKDKIGIPVLISVHGWSQDMTYKSDAELKVLSNSFFVASVGLRSKNGASGTKDASGRELHDIYDLINYIKANYSLVVDTSRIAIEGYSGGGGNSLGMATKFPDLANVIGVSSAIADYGYDTTDSWYITYPTIQTELDQIFGARASNLNKYRSRYSVDAINNYLGYLYLVHAVGDTTVSVVNSRKIDTALVAGHTYTELAGGAHPCTMTAGFYTKVLTESTKLIPDTGTLRINGYVVTKKFSIWLDTGIESVADVTFDVPANSYTITPITSGSIVVKITQGTKTATETISAVTTIIAS